MRLLILFSLLVCAFSYPSSSCLKSNLGCKVEDMSVADYVLCGEAPAQTFPTDPSILPAAGTGKMRKPEDCDGICVDIMSQADKDSLVCNNAVNLNYDNCTRFKNAKHCVADSGAILMWVGIGIVLIAGCTCCLVYNPNRKKTGV